MNDISRDVWAAKYRLQDENGPIEKTIEETWQRIARSLAAAESGDRTQWETRFGQALADFRFLPGGRIYAGAGTNRRVTLFNCFVMGTIDDSMDGIFDALKEGALTMQQGGGVGYDFSTLRPRGATAKGGGTIASGPVSFMRIWDAMCGTILSTGARRGAMMGTLRCEHPDIEEFVQAKQVVRARRQKTVGDRQVDGRAAAVDVSPVDHTAQLAFGVDEQVSRVEVSVDEDETAAVRCGRRGLERLFDDGVERPQIAGEFERTKPL